MTCPRCTFSNPPGFAECEVCGGKLLAAASTMTTLISPLDTTEANRKAATFSENYVELVSVRRAVTPDPRLGHFSHAHRSNASVVPAVINPLDQASLDATAVQTVPHSHAVSPPEI